VARRDESLRDTCTELNGALQGISLLLERVANFPDENSYNLSRCGLVTMRDDLSSVGMTIIAFAAQRSTVNDIRSTLIWSFVKEERFIDTSSVVTNCL